MTKATTRARSTRRESFRIRIGLRQVFVQVAVVALDEARGFLIEHRACGTQPQLPGSHVEIAQQIELCFVDSRIVAPARACVAIP